MHELPRSTNKIDELNNKKPNSTSSDTITNEEKQKQKPNGKYMNENKRFH